MNFSHWHADFEFGILLEGKVDYFIGDTLIPLEKGDGFFVNANIPHTNTEAADTENANLFTLAFPVGSLVTGTNSDVYTKYFLPLLNKRVDGFKITSESSVGEDIKTFLMKIYAIDTAAYGYELQRLAYLSQLWLAALQYIKDNQGGLLYHNSDVRDDARIERILTYIHENYNKKLTAENIANHSGISRSECFRCFKQSMNQSLVSYINGYRLQRAAKLLRDTQKSIVKISTECGFNSTNHFGKMFKNTYSMTPSQYQNAQVWTDNVQKNINGYDYEYWKDIGNGTMIIPSDASNGSFSCEWGGVHNITFRSGKKFYNFEKTHSQMGNIALNYDAIYQADGCFFINIYGWTVDPLVEWYITECYTANKPPVGASCLGTLNVDGGIYEIFPAIMANSPSILGRKTFAQYWSIRTSARSSGSVDVSAHFKMWESLGMKMGRLAEVNLSVESLRGRGNAAVHSNIITIF